MYVMDSAFYKKTGSLGNKTLQTIAETSCCRLAYILTTARYFCHIKETVIKSHHLFYC